VNKGELVNGSMIKEELYRWLKLERPTDESGSPYPPGALSFSEVQRGVV
jgi:hypothetical protein